MSDEISENYVKHACEVFIHLEIAKSQNLEAALFQICGPRLFVVVPCVLNSIEFDDEASLKATKVDDISPNRYLATKLCVAELTAA